MAKKKVEFEITRPKFLVAAALAITGLIAAAHLFITYVVFPAAERYIVIDIPSKSGGQTFYTSDIEYQSTSYILLGVAAALLAAVLLLVAAHKYVAAFLASFVYAMAGGFYAAIMLGNGFHELWGGWWSALGVVIAVVLYFGAVALIVWSAYKNPECPPATNYMKSIRASLSTFSHRYLKVPYTLHVHEFQSPKRPRATFVFIHGIGNTLHSWDEVVAQMPDDVRLIGIDLLGFGKSPRPDWVVYDAKTQARSLGITLLGLRMAHQPILVGHSLGALVAVEVAKRYSLLPRRLVLCSPPFYKPLSEEKSKISGDDVLRELYKVAKRYPERLEALSPVAVRFGLANKSLNITQDNVGSYFAALEASIINQTSLQDVAKLKMPIDIFYGAFDPVVIKKHITKLAKDNKNITAKRLMAGHEVIAGYVGSVSKHLKDVIDVTER